METSDKQVIKNFAADFMAQYFPFLGTLQTIWENHQKRKYEAFSKALHESYSHQETAPISEKFREKANSEEFQDFIFARFSELHRSRCRKGARALGILLGKFLESGEWSFEDDICAGVCAEISDSDLDILRVLESKTPKSGEGVTHGHAFRFEAKHLPWFNFEESDGIKLDHLRSKIDKLRDLGALSSDEGGMGNSGYAHGFFRISRITRRILALTA